MPWGTTTVRGFILASVFGSAKRAGAPATCYFALAYHATPTLILGTEATIGTGAYARVGIVNDDVLWTITAETGTNDVEVRWALASAPYSPTALNQWAIFDAATAGNCWAFGALALDLDISVAGRQPVAPAGAIDLTQGA